MHILINSANPVKFVFPLNYQVQIPMIINSSLTGNYYFIYIYPSKKDLHYEH